MRVTMYAVSGILRFQLETEKNDILEPSEKFRLGSRIVEIHLPSGLDPDSIHPDHIALCIIMITHPFIGDSLVLPKPVSERFSKFHNLKSSRYSIGPVDQNLKPWEPGINYRPGLAFSGGVDSTAALAVMPPTTAPVFMDRPTGKKSLYNKDAVIQSCLQVQRLGYDMRLIQCDLEYVRDPVGFPVDVANSVPAVLMADYLKLDCIGFGTIMESTYGTGHRLFRDYPNGTHYTYWGGLFKAAGLPFILPVAGISEVGTSIIVSQAPLGMVAQSCMRGVWKKPCLNCWKCFRKQLLDNAILKNQVEAQYLDELFNNKEASRFLGRVPIKHENVLAWSTHRLNSEHQLYSLLKERVQGHKEKLEWLEKWYSPSIDLIPEKYQEKIKEKISRYLLTMNELEEQELTSWDMNDIISSEKVAKQSLRLSQEMSSRLRPRR
ncbi:MAG: hypothetical protein CMI27_02420 [Opitutae bacterium]|nr:hypothetical protein [Opitutae bacterium]